MQLSQMCSFVSPGALPAATTNYDIYHPSLWLATRQYIVNRMEMLRTACRGCDVLGMCQGGCVYTGLDVHNKLNPSGCNYQRALFRHVIDYAHSGEVRSMPPGEIRDHQRTAAAADVAHQAPKAVPLAFYKPGSTSQLRP
jgi:radical SAM protein with 4Fe4S-binding SPASM domain